MKTTEGIVNLRFPDRSMTDQILPKYKIKEHAEANKRDEKIIHQVIEEVKITHILNQATTDIPSIVSDKAEYKSVFVLHVCLRQSKQLFRIAEILMGAINSALLLVYQFGDRYAFATALRGVPADGAKGWVSKELLVTDFIQAHQYLDAQPLFPQFLPSNIEQLVQYFHLKVRQLIAYQLDFPKSEKTPTYTQIHSVKSGLKEIERLTKEAQAASSIAEQVRLNQEIALLRKSLFNEANNGDLE